MAISEIIVCFCRVVSSRGVQRWGGLHFISFPPPLPPSVVIQNVGATPFVFFWCVVCQLRWKSALTVNTQLFRKCLEASPFFSFLRAFLRMLVGFTERNKKKTAKKKNNTCISLFRQRRGLAVWAVLAAAWRNDGGRKPSQ